MPISKRIGDCKKDNDVTVFQVNRWDEVVRARTARGQAMGLDRGFTRDLLRLVRHEPIHLQPGVMNREEAASA